MAGANKSFASAFIALLLFLFGSLSHQRLTLRMAPQVNRDEGADGHNLQILFLNNLEYLLAERAGDALALELFGDFGVRAR